MTVLLPEPVPNLTASPGIASNVPPSTVVCKQLVTKIPSVVISLKLQLETIKPLALLAKIPTVPVSVSVKLDNLISLYICVS